MTQRVELEHKNRVLSEVPDRKDGLKEETLIEQVTQNAASGDALSMRESKEVYSRPSKVTSVFFFFLIIMQNPMKYCQSIHGKS